MTFSLIDAIASALTERFNNFISNKMLTTPEEFSALTGACYVKQAEPGSLNHEATIVPEMVAGIPGCGALLCREFVVVTTFIVNNMAWHTLQGVIVEISPIATPYRGLLDQ